MKRHIIFDFDDTISSGYEHNQNLFVETFLPYKPDIDQEYVRMLHYIKRGTSMELQFAKIIKKYNLNVTPKQLVEENELLHQKYADEVVMFDNFEEILKHFKRLGKTISICSNRQTISLKKILEKNNLSKYFDNIISCRDEGYEKPHPYCLVKLMEKYPNISKTETIYFGDSKTDAEFAENAGIDYLIIDHYLNKKHFYILALEAFAGIEEELLVEVNKNNQEIGSLYKTEAYVNPSRLHRSVHVILFNSKGEVILQKRADTKMYEPGKWDVVGGFQVCGQTIKDTARIETIEEMGVKPKLNFGKKYFREDQGAFYTIYYAFNDGPYRFNMHEVSKVKIFNCEKLLNHHYDKSYPILEHVYSYLENFRSVWEPLTKK